MRYFFHLLIYISMLFNGFSQPYALLLHEKSHAEWDTVCVFRQSELLITQSGELLFQHSSCLPVSTESNVLYFVFPNNTYFLVNIRTIFSSIYGEYPFIQVHHDSIRAMSYKVETSHLRDTLPWMHFVEKWNATSDNVYTIEKTFLEICSSYIVYEGDTLNRYDDFHQKDGKWIVYDINNVFREDSTSFYLPFDVSVLAEQHFEHGAKTGTWLGYYSTGQKCYRCEFEDDSMVNGIFYKQDGKIRYRYLNKENDSFFVKDYTDRRKKIHVSKEEMMKWLRL